jgi:hypothetical protein
VGRMITEAPCHDKIMTARHRRKIERTHARKRLVPERQSSSQITQTIDCVSSYITHIFEACIRGVAISVDISEKEDAHRPPSLDEP